MPLLIPTGQAARVTWIGVVPDRTASLAAAPLERAELTFAGIAGEAHAGLTRPSCSRVTMLYDKGTEIRNTRQLSILSEEDLDAIAAGMGLDRLDPAWLGASMVVAGIPDFTLVPPGARLRLASGAVVTVDMENRPCHLPVEVIERHHPGKGKAFRTAAQRRRGVTAWVEREGPLARGDGVTLFVPDQPRWPHDPAG